MSISVRAALLVIGVAFVLYHAARTLFWTDSVDHPWMVIGVALLIVAASLLCMVVEPRTLRDAPRPEGAADPGPRELPIWAVVIAFAVTAITPTAIAYGIGPERVSAPYATSYIGAIGTLFTIVMIRRRTVSAWIGVGILMVGAIVWLTPLGAFSFGLVGAIMWVGVAQIIRNSLDRAALDTIRLVELQQAAVAWQAAQSVRRRDRRVRVQFALQVAGPILTRVVANAGALSAEERREARIAEGTLRDELRGAALLDEQVRTAIEHARRTGTTVTVFDEGGLDGLGPQTLHRIRTELAETITRSGSARLIIRTSKHPQTAVTIVGRSAAAAGLTDEDAVELWQEISR